MVHDYRKAGLMIKADVVRVGRRQGSVVVGLLVAMLVAVGSTSAAGAAPTGEYAVFSDCPLSDAALGGCINSTTESGEFAIGDQKLPIVTPFTLQGGFIESETGFTFVGAADGNTISKTPVKVEGGLLGVTKCSAVKNWIARIGCQLLQTSKVTTVTATTELAGPASSILLSPGSLFAAQGPALVLPVKVHLENALLGKECYIGSDSSPIVLELTTGTTSPPLPNTPIKGSTGSLAFNGEGTILSLIGESLVNNTFAVPAATGCGGPLAFLIDPVVNARLGLPATPGHNTAIFTGTYKQAGAAIVREHEG
jgi:hypothetical protein